MWSLNFVLPQGGEGRCAVGVVWMWACGTRGGGGGGTGRYGWSAVIKALKHI